MTKASHSRGLRQSGDFAGKSRRDRRALGAVMQAVQTHFAGRKTKIPLELALRTEAHPRNTEKWLARAADPSAENLIELMRSDLGDVVLAAAMGTDPKRWPAWYARLNRQLKLSDLRKGLEAQRKALEALEREGA